MVAVYASPAALFEVSRTGPGALRIEGIASDVVLPERGAMIATATSSYPMRTSCLVPCRLPRRMPVSLASMRLAVFRLGRRERALSVMALAIRGSMSSGLAMPAIFFFRPPLVLWRDHRTTAAVASASSAAAGTMRAPMSRDGSPVWGQSWSGWSSAVVGAYVAQGRPASQAVMLPDSQTRWDRGTTMAATPRRRRKAMS